MTPPTIIGVAFLSAACYTLAGAFLNVPLEGHGRRWIAGVICLTAGAVGLALLVAHVVSG